MADNHDKIFKSPINTSISKNLYSFPKSERFEKTRESSYLQIYAVAKNHFTTSRRDLSRQDPLPLAMVTKLT